MCGLAIAIYSNSWRCTRSVMQASFFDRVTALCCAWCRRCRAVGNAGRTITSSFSMVRSAFTRLFTPSISAFLDRANANVHTTFHLGVCFPDWRSANWVEPTVQVNACESPVNSFRIKAPALVLLLGLLAVITLILVLPDVDLLDTAFQRNTSPVVLCAHFHSVPQFRSTATLLSLFLSIGMWLLVCNRVRFPRVLARHLQILHHSLRC